MKPSATKPTLAALTEGQRAALLTLLADEDPSIYQAVREKILAHGQSTREWLRPHTLSSDPLLRRRAQEITQHLARQSADDRFLTFCLQHHGQDFDLEHGAWLLAQTQYPEANLEAYSALLDSYAIELREHLPPGGAAKATLTVINRFLFTKLGFRGDEQKYYDPENSYLNRVIDRRRGNPISLCLIYLFLARRLRLPIVGVGLPGHFLARFQNSSDEVYIDAFYRGHFLTKNDCIHHLIRNHYPLDDAHFSPATPRQVLRRICANLHQSYVQMKSTEEAARVQRYLLGLAR